MKSSVKIWLLLLCLWACGRAMSLPSISSVSEYAAYIQLDIASVTNNHTIAVKHNVTGLNLTPGTGIAVARSACRACCER